MRMNKYYEMMLLDARMSHEESDNPGRYSDVKPCPFCIADGAESRFQLKMGSDKVVASRVRKDGDPLPYCINCPLLNLIPDNTFIAKKELLYSCEKVGRYILAAWEKRLEDLWIGL